MSLIYRRKLSQIQKLTLGFTLCFLFVSSVNLFAQTPGLIFDPATGAGKIVLDPNSDGYVSQTTAGFISNDESESEIPFYPMIFPSTEPNSDLGPGPDCGFTDFVQQTVGVQDAGQYYLDASNNWLFRMRLGGASTNSKSYSILIDTDQKFGLSGPNADPNYVSGNPGFEIELVLSTNFGVYVYNVDGTTTPVLKRTYAGHTNYQKSIALSTACSDPDYFYDFFVPFGDLTTDFGITTSTPVRLVLIDNMAASSSTIGHLTSASDLGGLDDASCSSNYESCFGTIIDNYTPCPPSGGPCPDRSLCPGISTINPGATSVSGTSSEANGTIITVYKNGVAVLPVSTTTVTAGTWTLTGISPALATNDTITATATAPGKGTSISNCNPITVQSCAVSTTVPAASDISTVAGSKGYSVIVNRPIGTIVRCYTANWVLIDPVALSLVAPDNLNTVTTTTSPQTVVFKCQTGNCFGTDVFIFTYQEPGKCESGPTFDCQYSTGTSGQPTINTPVLTTTSPITGTGTSAGASIYFYLDGIYLGTTTTGASPFNYSYTITATGTACQTLKVMQIEAGKCPNSPDVTTTLKTVSQIPVISGTYCTGTSISTITGTTGDPAGTQIIVFRNGVANDTTTSTASGSWTANSPVATYTASTTIFAKGTAACGTQSAASSTVTVGSVTSNTVAITSNPITEGDPSVSGTGTNGDIITLYIDGIQIGSTATVAGGTWTIGGFGALFLDGTITTSTASTAVTGSGTFFTTELSVGSKIYSANILIGTVLTITDDTHLTFAANATTTLSAQAFGSGFNELYSGGVVTATASSAGKCEGAPSAGKTVVCRTLLATLTVDPANAAICTGSTVTGVTVYSSQAGIAYQLYNNVLGANTGFSVIGNGSNITLSSGALTASTTLSVKAFLIPIGTCSATLTDNIPVTVNAIPTPTLAVSPSLTICNGSSLTLTASGATTYAWNPGGATTTSIVVSPTTNTSYTVTGTTPGCSGTATQSVIVNSLPSVTVTPGSTTTFCQGDNVTLDAGSGYSSYSWSPGGGTDQTFIASSSGDYSVTVTDGNSCSNTSTGVNVVVNSLPSVTVTAGGTTTFCQGGNVTLDAGSGYSSYVWSPGGGTDQTLVASASGDYSVTVTNSNNCSATSSGVNVLVNPSPAAVVVANGATTVCQGSSVILDAGNGFSSYSWMPGGGTDQTVSVSSSGSYSVTVTDANNCSATSSGFNVLINPSPTVTVTASGPTTFCQGPNVTLDAGSGFTSYSWNPGGGTDQTVSVSSSGDYSVTVTNANNCSATSSGMSIVVNPSPTVTITPGGPTAFCQGGNVTLDAGSGYTSYSWNPGGGTDQTVSVSSSGDYSVTVTNANNCSTTSTGVNVVVHPLPTVTVAASASTTFCQGSNITLNAGGGYSSYAWSPGGGTDQTLVVSTSGDYSVTVTNANNCSATSAGITVSVNPTPTAADAGTDSILACDSTSLALYANSPSVGTGTWTVISGTGTFANPNNPSTTVNGLSVGPNTFRWTISKPPCADSYDDVIITAVSCSGNNPPIANDTSVTVMENSTDTFCIPFTDIDTAEAFTATICGTVNGTASASINGNQLCVVFTPTQNYFGAGSICVVICDNGVPQLCDTVLISVTIIEELLSIPEGFSPNGDNVNDYFVIPGLENYPNNNIRIYNRWGDLVFAAQPYQNEWDGTNKHGITIGGEKLPTGTYFYTLDLGKEGTKVIKGYVYLTR